MIEHATLYTSLMECFRKLSKSTLLDHCNILSSKGSKNKNAFGEATFGWRYLCILGCWVWVLSQRDKRRQLDVR